MNDALTLPFFQSSSSGYTHTPPFPDNYEGAFTSGDDFYHGNYDLDNEGEGGIAPSSLTSGDRSRSNGESYCNRAKERLMIQLWDTLSPHLPPLPTQMGLSTKEHSTHPPHHLLPTCRISTPIQRF